MGETAIKNTKKSSGVQINTGGKKPGGVKSRHKPEKQNQKKPRSPSNDTDVDRVV